MRTIKEDSANFICPRCQGIYYQMPMEDFNDSPAKAEKTAREFKKYYHKCGKKRKGGAKV